MKSNFFKILLSVALIFVFLGQIDAAEMRNKKIYVTSGVKNRVKRALKYLRKGHPRLIMTKEMFAERKKLLKTDKNLQFYYSQIKKNADEILKQPMLAYNLHDGVRLLRVSRKMLHRIYTLGIVWKMTGDKKYAECARKNLLTVVAYPDWNPRHFLDTAEMTNAVGVGFDWFYDYLAKNDRDRIRNGLIKLGLTPDPREAVTRTNNWNVVCNGGLSIGALAIADTNPEYVEKILSRAIVSMPNCLKHYAPDGGWFEGPSYWGYTARYLAMCLSAMETAVGTDFGLSKLPGLDKAAEFPVYTSDDYGCYFRFADSGDGSRRGDTGSIFWFANRYNKLYLAKNEDKFAKKFGARAYHFIWYNPKMQNQKLMLDKDKLFMGEVPVAVFSNQKKEPNDIWIAAKAGTNGLPHGHLDVGNFELTINGVRWIADMGSDNYNLPGYWRGEVGGKRWSYPRLASGAHNVPVISGKGQIENASATVEKFVSKANYGFWILDMSKLYAGNNIIKRGIGICNARDEGHVRDEFYMDKDTKIKWGFMTKAEVTVRGNTVFLFDKKSRKKLLLFFNTNAPFFRIYASTIPYQEPAKSTDDYTRVQILFTAKAKKNTFLFLRFANIISFRKATFSSDGLVGENLNEWK